jgi:ABC-type transport system substrate-binding protein
MGGISMNHKSMRATLRPLIAASAIALLSCTALASQKDNSIVVAINTDFVMADPAVGTLGTDIPLLYVMYDRLFDFKPVDLTPIPMLATDWKWSDDKKTLTMNLRQDVKFHDGTDFNAEAVKKSIEYFKTSGRNKDLDDMAKVEALGPYSVAITMNEVNSQLPGLLAERAGMILSPTALEKYGKDFAQNPVGTGPYKFKQHIVGQTVFFEKFDGYWDKKALRVDTIEFRVLRNSTSAVAALMTGQIDYLPGVDPVNMPAMKANPNVRVEVEPTIGYGVFKLDTSIAPIDKKEVRQAFSLAVDREALAKAVYGPAVKAEGTVLGVPRNYWPSTTSIQDSIKYDPTKAKALLAKAGYPDGAKISVCINSQAGMPQPQLKVMDIITPQLKAAGITLDVQQTASTAGCAEIQNKKGAAMLLLMWTGRSDPAITYTQMLASNKLLPNSPFNLAKRDYGADDLLKQLNATFDQAGQKLVYDKLNAIFVDEYPFMPLYSFVNVVAYRAGLIGEEANMMGRPNVRTMYWKK